MLDKINELIEKEDYKNLKLEITNLNEVDIAEIIEDIDDKNERVKVFRLLPKDIAADAFANLPIDVQQELITSLSMKDCSSVLSCGNGYCSKVSQLGAPINNSFSHQLVPASSASRSVTLIEGIALARVL